MTASDEPITHPYRVVFMCPAEHTWDRDDWPVLHWVEEPGLMDRLTYGIPRSDNCPTCGLASVTGDYDNGNPVAVYNKLGEEGWRSVRSIRIRRVDDDTPFHYDVRCVACGEHWDNSGGQPESVVRLHEQSCLGQPRDEHAQGRRDSTLATEARHGRPPEVAMA